VASTDDVDDLGATAFPEPVDVADPATLLLRLLDFYRATAIRKVGSLRADQVRRSWVPTAWTPLELLCHLAHMEQRWIVWGFLGEDVPEPLGRRDRRPVARPAGRVRRRRGRAAARDGRPDPDRCWPTIGSQETGAVGGRFAADPPTLASIGFHVLQE
jgi:hypothetical protein